MSNELKAFLQSHCKRFNMDIYRKVFQYCAHRSVKRNEILLRPGRISDEIYFVEAGCIRTYKITDDGRENTIDLCFERSYTRLLFPFYFQMPSDVYVEAAMESELYIIKYNDFLRLGKIVPVFHWSRWMDIFYENYSFQIELLSLTADERYSWLLENRPEYVQRISSKLIASYLGITQRTITRIRHNQKLKK